ncbi:RipA family octameric membrane protein [Dactylosporangium sp. CA-139114]|uniref:RipA family octameric membrane protein n=1 Tax=Dactylosporangium sp. CA-139114 TaxID=3239931 RepID=UPI003D963C74
MTFPAKRLVLRESSSIDDARAGLWSEGIDQSRYGTDEDKYRAAILEQYKLYVEMTDRASARRGITNTFFLTLNTALLAAGAGIASRFTGHIGLRALVTVALIVQCVAWYSVLRSYRQLASVKYRVIGALEERLPASPYWAAEWRAIGQGKDKARYIPVTRLEQWVPAVFALSYATAFLLELNA